MLQQWPGLTEDPLINSVLCSLPLAPPSPSQNPCDWFALRRSLKRGEVNTAVPDLEILQFHSRIFQDLSQRQPINFMLSTECTEFY